MKRNDSTHDPAFQATVQEWMLDRGEVLAMFRWPNCGGSRSFEFFKIPAEFSVRLREMPAGTSIIVFREEHLPVRGLVDDDLIHEAIEVVPHGVEYLITGLDLVTRGPVSWYPESAGETHEELRADLNEWWPDVRAAIGQHPRWWDASAVLVEAYVPNEDGTVTRGAY